MDNLRGMAFHKKTGIQVGFETDVDTFIKGFYQEFTRNMTLDEYVKVVSIFKSGLITESDLHWFKQFLLEKTFLEKFVFNVYQVKVQHKEMRIYCLNKNALASILCPVGVNPNGVHGGATYYNDGHIWEVSKITLEI